MNQRASSAALPPDFPSELAVTAFVSGEETAWKPADALASVEWFGAHGYAVLGTELWLLQDGWIQSLPIGTSGLREVHGNTVNSNKDEDWNSFVGRSTTETAAYLRGFNPADIVEKGDLHFQVSWIDQKDFEDLLARRGRYGLLA